ncbi:TolC family protein [Legionella qingyii]|uniref:TolC family protein n=1 Tax=Legionella qingyii TaxID=2184757 RepID=UPI000F8EA0CB|nr:TolC family protein [Legionella qingyii]RUR24280.1 TolC family protein [Legionella qingyii]
MKRYYTHSGFKNQLILGFCYLLLSTVCIANEPHKLTLDKVLQSVTLYYPKIKIARLEITKAQGAHLSALGTFDPSLDASSRSQPAGGYINNYGDTQLTVPTFYNGVKLFAGYRNGNGNWPIYYQNYLTNSGGEYRAGLSLPLLRDRLIDKERTNLLTTAESIEMKKHDAEAIKIKIYQETIKAYWQWVEAGLQLKTFRQLLKLAQKRQHAIEQQANQGDLPKLAITENLQQIVQREQLLNQGKMIFEQAGINLSLYYRDEQGNPKIPSENSLPSQVLTNPRQLTSGLSQLAHHPSLKKLENYSRIIKLKRDLAQNELLPNLDATAYTFKQNGTGGYPLLLPEAAFIGVSFKFPVLQREAKGKLIRTQSELYQIRAEQKFMYEQLKNELTNLYIGIKRIHQQVAFLKKEYHLAFKVQQGETQKFHEGDSTLFLVNQREQATTQVKLNWINAQVQQEELKDLVRFFSSADINFPLKKGFGAPKNYGLTK